MYKLSQFWYSYKLGICTKMLQELRLFPKRRTRCDLLVYLDMPTNWHNIASSNYKHHAPGNRLCYRIDVHTMYGIYSCYQLWL